MNRAGLLAEAKRRGIAFTPADSERVTVAYHEAGHAVAAVLAGGKVHQAVLGDTPQIQHDDVPEHHCPGVTYAGPWAEARWIAGRYPTSRQLHRVLAGTVDHKELCAAGGPAAATAGGLVTLLERCWPAVTTVARKLFVTGQVDHADVTAALGLSDEGGPGSFELANIRAGLRAVS